jgi:hypothetical protein
VEATVARRGSAADATTPRRPAAQLLPGDIRQEAWLRSVRGVAPPELLLTHGPGCPVLYTVVVRMLKKKA